MAGCSGGMIRRADVASLTWAGDLVAADWSSYVVGGAKRDTWRIPVQLALSSYERAYRSTEEQRTRE